jgi:poly(hydroxyalkanoate) depolymerase family esterase
MLIPILISLSAEAKFVLHEPNPLPDKLAPLFVVLHGFSSSAKDVANVTRFSEIADKEGFYVLYPESEDPNVFAKCWKYYLSDQQIPGHGEASLIIQEIERIKTNYPIDPSKVFLTGMSAGASMASILAACYPNSFQGVAFASGTSYGLSSRIDQALLDIKAGPSPVRPANDACNPADFKGKVMVFHGSKDELVNAKHFDRYIKDFLSNTKVASHNIPENWLHFPYSQQLFIRNKILVGQTYFVEGMIHTWSGGTTDGRDKNSNPTRMGPNATELILQFFLQ